MRKLMRVIPVSFVLVLLTMIVGGLFVSARAAEIIDPGKDPMGVLAQVYAFFINKNWAPLIATVLYLMVWAFKKIWPALAVNKYVGWGLNFGASATVAFVLAITTGQPLWPALLSAIISSAMATAGYELKKDVVKSATGADSSPPVAAASQR